MTTGRSPAWGWGFAFDAGGSGPWTAGYQLCVNQGTAPVILVRLIPADSGGAIGTAAGFPPQVSEVLHPVAGLAVMQQCNFNSSQPAVRTSTSELDVGVGKPAGSTGGGWSALTVDYRAGSTQYAVTFDAGLYVRGPNAPAAAGCNQPEPTHERRLRERATTTARSRVGKTCTNLVATESVVRRRRHGQ
jgi:hypothetical protein